MLRALAFLSCCFIARARVVEVSCADRIGKQPCNRTCLQKFVENNGDCYGILQGTCYNKYAKYFVGRTERFLSIFPECVLSHQSSSCEAKLIGAQAMFSGDADSFEESFIAKFPGCASRLVTDRRLYQVQTRYSLCNISSNGYYSISSNCSVTQTIAAGNLHVGVLGAGGRRPSIDGSNSDGKSSHCVHCSG